MFEPTTLENSNDLLNQSVIRIIINDGPRFGNQSANFSLMGKLRELGFKGKFHIIYPATMDPFTGKVEDMSNQVGGTVGEKIAHFVSEYNPNGTDKQFFEGIEIEKKVWFGDSLVLNSLPYVPVAMTAADEGGVSSVDNCKMYNCGAFITLRPIYWRGKNKIEFLNGDIDEWSKDLRLISNVKPKISLDEIKNEKERKLLELTLEAKKHGVDFQSMYGRVSGLPLKTAIERLVVSLMASKKNQEPCTILFVHEEPTELDKTFDPKKFEVIGSMDNAIKKLEEPGFQEHSKGKVILVYTGALNQKAFTLLQLESPLPPLVEGANSSEALEVRGYLHCLSTPSENSILSTDDAIKFNMNPNDAALYNAACDSLSNPDGSVDSLITFMKKYKDGLMDDYFEKRKKWFFKKDDVISCSRKAISQAYLYKKIPELSSGETALMWAIKKGDIDAVQCLLKNGASLSQKDTNGLTVSDYVVTYNQDKIGKIIKAHQELLSIAKEMTPRGKGKKLVAAARRGKLAIVKELVTAGADIYVTKDGGTALEWAIHNRNNEIATLLLEKTDLRKDEKYTRTLFQMALDKGLDKIVDQLIEKGIDINAANEKGVTTLMWAAKAGHLEIVKILLEKKADPNLTDKEGKNTLQYAESCWDGLAHKESILALIKQYQKEPLSPIQKNRY